MTQGPYHQGKNIVSASRLNQTDSLSRRPLYVGPGLKLEVTGTSQRLSLVPEKTQAVAQAAGVAVKQFKIKETGSGFGSDALICNTWSNDALGADDIWVLKPWFLRGALTWASDLGQDRPRNGIRYTRYTSGSQTRTATKGDEEEIQKIVPAYLPGDIIIGLQMDTGAEALGESVDWMDLNVDGRMWAKD